MQCFLSFILKVFLDLDVENSGRIQPEALRNVLNEFTLRLTNDHFSQLWNKFDQNIDGSISYRDFLKYFVGNGMGLEEQIKDQKDVSLRIDDVDIDNSKVRMENVIWMSQEGKVFYMYTG